MEPTLVLVGDSVTDCGRSRSDDHDLGSGWVALVGAALTAEPATRRRVLNRGIRATARSIWLLGGTTTCSRPGRTPWRS